MTSIHNEDHPHRPDYPPKTPPPPKKPVEAPRPAIDTGKGKKSVLVQPRLRARIANRRAANWTYEAAAWSGPKAARAVVEKTTAWGYRVLQDHALPAATEALVRAAADAGGRRLSVHLADQDHQALVLVLSHEPEHTSNDQTLLHQIAGLGVNSCGIDTDRTDGGRRRWALIDL
ncbi:hypothetical protein [Streptomyces sp. NPDC047981]|uniref:hypothetical protein n=1 Tax=Streptomyces sp. NPDC047981 TaxID=3154610 RepID=UPI00342031EE